MPQKKLRFLNRAITSEMTLENFSKTKLAFFMDGIKSYFPADYKINNNQNKTGLLFNNKKNIFDILNGNKSTDNPDIDEPENPSEDKKEIYIPEFNKNVNVDWSHLVLMPYNTKSFNMSDILSEDELESLTYEAIVGEEEDGINRNLEIRFIGTTTQPLPNATLDKNYTMQGSPVMDDDIILANEDGVTDYDINLNATKLFEDGILFPWDDDQTLVGGYDDYEKTAFANMMNAGHEMKFKTAPFSGIMPDGEYDPTLFLGSCSFRNTVNPIFLIRYNKDGVIDANDPSVTEERHMEDLEPSEEE